jgi:GNAT superfamily N-acetyltransferase
MLNPRNLTFLAVHPRVWNGKFWEPEEVVGEAQFIRLGDDEGAKKQIASRKSVWHWVLSWIVWALVKLWTVLLGGNKSVDPANDKIFSQSVAEHEEKHWSEVEFPERKNRWLAQSVVVAPEYHRKGIGRKLMAEVIKRAEDEGVPIGLHASPRGEPLYRSLGFDLLARFDLVIAEHEKDRGGVFLWTPKSKRGENSMASE